MKNSTWTRAAAAVLLVATIVVTVGLLPVQEYLISFLAWVQANRLLGAVLLALIYIPACLLFIPGSLITLGAGFALGVFWGTAAVSVGSVLGASAAFMAGRTLARGLIEQHVAKNIRFAAIDQAVADHGFKIVLLTRLSPVFPFNLLNYAYGLTQVSLRDYVLASWIGMLPGTVMYVYLGSAVKNLADLAAGRVEKGTGQTVLYFVGLLATVGVTLYVTRVARQALGKAVGAQAAIPAADSKTSPSREPLHPSHVTNGDS